MRRTLVSWTVIAIGILTGGLAFYLYWIGTLLTRIAANLEDSADRVRAIDGDAKVIGPGVQRINQTGGVVAGALPLLYGMAEEIVRAVAGQPAAPPPGEPTRPASGTRRSRLHEATGFSPPG